MSVGVIQVLVVFLCVRLSIFSKIEEVKPRWVYNNNNADNSKTRSLPDFIEFDLQLGSGKITLNLTKQSAESAGPLLTITQSVGQSSIWKHREEFLSTYKDSSFDASSTVTFKNIGGYNETFYLITFSHGDKSISLEPRVIYLYDHPFTNTTEGDDDTTTTKLVNIDGVLHLLSESQLMQTMKDNTLDKGFASEVVKNGRIVKRFSQTEEKRLFTIEIFTVMDYSLYRKFYDLSKATNDKEKSEDAVKTIIFIFTHVMKKVNIIMERIDSKDYKVTTKWIGTFISKNASDTPFIENNFIDDNSLNSSTTYRGLYFWQKQKKQDGSEFPKYDYLIFFTSYNLMPEEKGKITYGMTFTGDICYTYNYALVTYNRFFITTKTIAHELGHTLGMSHDPDTLLGNIMAPYLDYTNDDLHKSYFFNEYSVHRMNIKIGYLDMFERNCLTSQVNDFKIPDENIISNLYPGQIYDPDDQCRLANGFESRFIGGYENLCQVLGCTVGYQLSAMDGTTCSNGAWCQSGKCVQNGRAPKAPESCINGDYKLKIPKAEDSDLKENIRCKDVEVDPNLCTSKTFKQYCCASCAGNGTGGCQDIVEECPNLEPRDCYYDYYAITCCKTCSALVQNPSNVNCLYGDRGSNCSEIVPTVCHFSSQYCCQTCTPNLSSINTIYNISDFPSNTSVSPAATNLTTDSVTTTTLPLYLTTTSTESTNGSERIYANSALSETTSLPSTPSKTATQIVISTVANPDTTTGSETISSSSSPSETTCLPSTPSTVPIAANTGLYEQETQIVETSIYSQETTNAYSTITDITYPTISITSDAAGSSVEETKISDTSILSLEITNAISTFTDITTTISPTTSIGSDAPETTSLASILPNAMTQPIVTNFKNTELSEYEMANTDTNNASPQATKGISTIIPSTIADFTSNPSKTIENISITTATTENLSNSSEATFEAPFTSSTHSPVTATSFLPHSKSSTSALSGVCKDFNGYLSLEGVWAKPLIGNCKSLVNHNPSFCNDENFQKYCCGSCSVANVVEDNCTSDDDITFPFQPSSKIVSCKQIAKHSPWMCETKDMRKRCCKSCGRFTVKPLKFVQKSV